MANTFVKIASATVGSGGVASVTFSSIPQTFTDLKILFSLRSPIDFLAMNINSVTTGYTARLLQGNGAAASSYQQVQPWHANMTNNNSFTANVFSNGEIYIPNYTSGTFKSYSADSVVENNASTAYITIGAWLFSNTAAITSLMFDTQTAVNISQFSSITLYGIKKN